MTLETLRAMARAFSKLSANVLGRPDAEPEEEEDPVPDEETPCLQAAIREYSRQKPRTQKTWIPAAGDDYLLAEWVESSTMRSVRIEDGTSRQLIDERDWRVYQAEDETWRLRLADAYQSGKLILEQLAPHTATAEDSTVPDGDQEALAHLAASYLLTAAANKYAANASSTISGDATSQSEQSKAYSFQAKDEFSIWQRFLSQSQVNRSTRLTWDMRSTEQKGLGRFWRRRGQIGL